MLVAFIFVTHLASLALAIVGIVRSGERPQVLLYAFVFEYLLRIASVHAGGRLIVALSSRPMPAQATYPLAEEGSGRPMGIPSYFVVLAFLGFLVFVLGNVNSEHELEVDPGIFLQDIGWAAALALLYWVQALVSKSLVIDPDAAVEINLGYNSRDLTILALATLTAGIVVVVRQSMKLPETGWTVLAPLLTLRFLFDVLHDYKLTAARPKPP